MHTQQSFLMHPFPLGELQEAAFHSTLKQNRLKPSIPLNYSFQKMLSNLFNIILAFHKVFVLTPILITALRVSHEYSLLNVHTPFSMIIINCVMRCHRISTLLG